MNHADHRVVRWAIRAVVTVLAVAGLPILTAGGASADTVSISTYDIIDSPESGAGGWSHTYSQPFVPTGIDPVQLVRLGTYTGGFGTLNDGVIGTSVSNTHLFFTGTRAKPVITLHLSSATFVDTIEIFGGDIDFNAIPGGLSQLNVTIGGSSLSLSTEPFGVLGASGTPVNDRVTLVGTPLAEIATDTIVLTDVVGVFEQFSITEITVSGRPAVTPPSTVGIDILPGEKLATISASSNGTIPVAVLSTATFNAVDTVDTATLTFGRTGSERSLKSCGAPRDVNRDGRKDLICSFNGSAAAFARGDTTGFLRGMTVTGKSFAGTDTIRVK